MSRGASAPAAPAATSGTGNSASSGQVWRNLAALPNEAKVAVAFDGCAFQLRASSQADMSTDARVGAFMDTVNVRPGETLRLLLRIDTPGRRMFHCHILEHEDQGMMAIANVLP